MTPPPEGHTLPSWSPTETPTLSPNVHTDGTPLTDESGGIVKMIIPAGQANPGTDLVVWNGHGDATGLWRITADGTLELANSFSYGTWGEPGITAGTNSATGLSYGDLGFRFLYVGRYGVQWDGAYGPPLYLMGARHYHATFGRFLQPDPSALEANLYAYAGNSPMTYVDSAPYRPPPVGSLSGGTGESPPRAADSSTQVDSSQRNSSTRSTTHSV